MDIYVENTITRTFDIRIKKCRQMLMPSYKIFFTRELAAKYYADEYVYLEKQYMENIWKLVQNMPVEVKVKGSYTEIWPKSKDELYDALMELDRLDKQPEEKKEEKKQEPKKKPAKQKEKINEEKKVEIKSENVMPHPPTPIKSSSPIKGELSQSPKRKLMQPAEKIHIDEEEEKPFIKENPNYVEQPNNKTNKK